MAARLLLTSFAPNATPGSQRRRERAFLEAGLLDESHLHVSTLDGDVLAIGAFHLDPTPGDDPAEHGFVWRRRTGGRAVSAGRGFLVVTLGLPHRSALVSDERYALKPEQVMNRCVRGLLAWLRRSGVDASYPGLDAVTTGRRLLCHSSFTEIEQGPTLFQAIVALDGSFADTPLLLDRLDPRGRVPAQMIAGIEATNLASCGKRWTSGPASAVDLPTLTGEIAAAYAETSGLEPAELDPAVTELLAAVSEDEAPSRPAADANAASASERGLLGQVTAVARVDAGHVASFALHGDFIAPDWAIDALCARINGGPARADAIVAAADSVLDGRRGYLLGLQPAPLRELLVRAVVQAQ